MLQLEKELNGIRKILKTIRNDIREAKDLEKEKGEINKDILEVVDWINKRAPVDGNEEKYDHVTAILEQLSREP